MNFMQKKWIRGKTVKHHKEWYDETEEYRITWRDQSFDVDVQPSYFACVRCVRSPDDSFEYWGFAGRSMYKTLKAAEEACELNHRVWTQCLTIDGRGKVTQVRDLEDRATVGKGKNAHSLMRDLPRWVVQQATPRLLEILCSDPKDRTKAFRTSSGASSPTGEKSEITARPDSDTVDGPAQPADQSDTSPDTNSNVPSASEPKTEPTKRAGKPIAKKSASGKRTRKSTTTTKKSKKKRSKSSRRKKSKPSKS